jgi:metallo-beta-lactamase family protein
MADTSTLHFCGGVGEVTGANFWLENKEINILVDCGLIQGARFCDSCNLDPFLYDPAVIDVLFVTHAHMDHIGRIPLLVERGFNGIIYSTPATRDLVGVMYEDSLKLMVEEAHREGTEPLYSEEAVQKALSLWKTLEYHQPLALRGDFNVVLKDAGHILGSAMVEIERAGRRLVVTGDLGNSPAPLLKDTESIAGAHYLVMESVYGDRNHEESEERTELLRSIITDTISQKGVLLVPAFSIERTQVLLYEINNLVESGLIPNVPVFLDSPLAIAVTSIYKKYAHAFNKEVRCAIKEGDDIFDFPQLNFTESVEASKEIAHTAPPKIIIAGAGMSHGGRIQYHEKRYLPDPSTTLLLVGFQVAGSLGRRLQDGASRISLLGEEVSVKGRVITLRGYSAHKDRDALLDFAAEGKETLEQIFVAMGETKASLFLAQRLRDFCELPATVPQAGSSVELVL